MERPSIKLKLPLRAQWRPTSNRVQDMPLQTSDDIVFLKSLEQISNTCNWPKDKFVMSEGTSGDTIKTDTKA